MGERQVPIKNGQEKISPILVICPEPGFKTSFFKENEVEDIGAEQFFWINENNRKKFENDSSMLAVYMNMSYKLPMDWTISLYEITRYLLYYNYDQG